MADLPEPPSLDPLGSLDFRFRREAGDGFEVPGRRAFVTGSGTAGIEAVWTHGAPVVRGLRPVGAVARSTVETPLGVERRLELAGSALVERVVASRDAPVVWLEWAADDGSGADDARPDGAAGPDPGAGSDPGPTSVELAWRMPLDRADAPPGAGSAGDGAPVLERDGRVLAVRHGAGFRAVLVFGTEPESVESRVETGAADTEAAADAVAAPGTAELAVRARLPLPADGLRLAILRIGPDDDADRLFRIAGRTAVAVRGREGAANRLLDDGLTLASPDPALDDAVARARLRLDASRIRSGPGGWSITRAVGDARARLVAGDFAVVRDFVHFLARRVDDQGRVPARGIGDRVLAYDDDPPAPGAGAAAFLDLTARYLAWSGDLPGVREIWDAVTRAAERTLHAPDPGPGIAEAPTAALQALAVAAETLGQTDQADHLRASTPDPDPAPAPVPSPGPDPGRGPEPDPHRHPSPSPELELESLHTLGEAILGADPDAPRGRLVLRPRPSDGWDRFEVRGLAVGSARVDVAYRREGAVHRLTLAQTRGAAPLQVVLEPELEGGRVAAARVDGEPAELDPVAVAGRWRVPVQLVLDRPRRLEVEFGDATP